MTAPANILLIGGGRMGQRHLRGLFRHAVNLHLVEPSSEAMDACVRIVADYPDATLAAFPSISALPPDVTYMAAVMAETAAGRLERFQQILALGVQNILVEKPLEQSRARVAAMVEAARISACRVWSNHYRRNLPGFKPLVGKGPYVISVSSGAMGLGCNGIHWLDFALHLSGCKSGRMLFGEIDSTPIQSGRGSQFQDYGGRGLFAFPDGSRLFLSCTAASSAPTAFSILGPHLHWVVDQHADTASQHWRTPDSRKPNYLYGADYETRSARGLEQADLAEQTSEWLAALLAGRNPSNPLLSQTAPAYELLFDLLEISGRRDFAFT
ncbi:MAG: Gfo/Idh/MocA family oxidoreductase [Ferrovibrio sp.]|uniref:Gfo/Idh/MocA family oxidoreductase n=1 Tax=Ferrovibrio sp. TaxID=1917215 RepID=UPI00391B0E18